VATVAALMFRYIPSTDFLFIRNAYFLGCFYVVDLPSFSLHRWYTDIEFFRLVAHKLSHVCSFLHGLMAPCPIGTNLTTATIVCSRSSSLRQS